MPRARASSPSARREVLCTASLEERGPPWLRGSGKGWVTAEYAMLPRATHERTRREVTSGKPSGRTQEIQRLIGRSLRAVVQPAGDRRAADRRRLRRDPGGRRHPHGLDHRRLGRAARLLRLDAVRARSSPSTRCASTSPRVLRHPRGHAGARPRLRRGFGRRDGRELRDHRLRRPGRGAGHGRGQAVLARTSSCALLRLAQGGRRRARRRCRRTRWLEATPAHSVSCGRA